MDAKGNWVSERAHQHYLEHRRKAYRAAHPRPTAEVGVATEGNTPL